MKSSTLTRNAANVVDAWWVDERQVPLALVPSHLPPRGNGRPRSVASTYRDTTAGLHGVKLRRFKSGGTWCTTLEEIVRWQRALTLLAGEGES